MPDVDATIHIGAKESLGDAASLAIPTSGHYLLMLYILGLKEEKEQSSVQRKCGDGFD